MNPFRIAVLGAPYTGKTRLADELVLALAPDLRGVVIADNPAATRTGSGMHGPAPEKHLLSAFDLILLTGMDLHASARQLEADAAIRGMLAAAALDYRVIYGHGAQRLANALAALPPAPLQKPPAAASQDAGQATAPPPPASGHEERAAWTWPCDKCSDPACEYALFTRLRPDRLQRTA